MKEIWTSELIECDDCCYSYRSVHPKGLYKLECPNCGNISKHNKIYDTKVQENLINNMKTPMQELIERLNNVKPTEFCSIETIKGWAESLLEKEKEQIMDAYTAGESDGEHYEDSYLRYYNEKYGVNK